MKARILGLLAVVMLIGPMAANAALMSTTLNNVTIGSFTWNVTFWQDSSGSTSFNDVFGTGGPGLTWIESSEALTAATAVKAAGDAINFNFAPFGSSNGFIVPYAYSPTGFRYVTGWANTTIQDGVFGPFSDLRTTNAVLSFATFAVAPVSSVPEPTTLALLGLGLVGIGVRRRIKAS